LLIEKPNATGSANQHSEISIQKSAFSIFGIHLRVRDKPVADTPNRAQVLRTSGLLFNMAP
jgi:hypothetical protein